MFSKFFIERPIFATVISLIIVFALNLFPITYNFGQQSGLLLSPTLGIKEILGVSVIVIIIALIATISPASKAARLGPVEALRTY